MSINLVKGGRINLSKECPSLTKVRVGLGWEPNATDTGTDFDLDASLFICKNDANGSPKLIADEYFVFYGNKTSPDGAVVHSGDDRTGGNSAVGDDETIRVDLTKLNPAVDELSFVVTIYEETKRKQNFGQVKNSYIKLYDDATGAEIAKYSLEDDFSTETAVQFGSLYKKDGAWSFKAVGTGYKKGLADFVVAYGGNLA
jgi:tellurium resistance protein TerD